MSSLREMASNDPLPLHQLTQSVWLSRFPLSKSFFLCICQKEALSTWKANLTHQHRVHIFLEMKQG